MATGNRLSTEIMINLAGNLTAKARQYGANMSQFARNHQKAMRLVKATTEAAGRGLDTLGNRYTAMIAGFGGGMTLKGLTDFDAQIRRAGTNAKLTDEQVSRLRKNIRETARMSDIRLSAQVLLEGQDALYGLTGKPEFVEKNIRNQGLATQAFGTAPQDVAALMAQMSEKQIEDPQEVEDMFDRFYHQFSIGSVGVDQLARVSAKLFSIYTGGGKEAMAQLGALEQMLAKTTGSADEAVTALNSIWSEVTRKDNIKFLKRNGVDVLDPVTGKPRLPYDVIRDVVRRAKFNEQNLQDVFGDTSMRGLRALSSEEALQLTEKMIYAPVESGAMKKAAEKNAQSFQSAMQSLKNEYEVFAEKNLAKPVQDLADAINSVDQNTVQNWLQVGKYMAIAVGGIIAIRKTYQFGKTLHDIMNPKGKGKGIPGGITDVFGSGVMPVYVVNMGSGGMNGNTGGLPDTPDSSRNPRNPRGPGNRGGKAGKGAGIIAGALEFYDFLTTQYALPGEVDSLTKFVAGDASASPWEREFAQQSQDNQKALESVWRKVTDWFNSLGDKNIADPRPWAGMQPTQNYPFLPQQLQGEIRVVVEGDARVKSVRVDQPGVRLSAQAGVTSVEQG
ncbi:phage tail protein [Escherichia coli]|uniref:phage tail protein n=1 Tax=Escherichia coli TaxID=562 RepID=UPI002A4BFB86|nr:phage tail protein [Escherichia coli]MCQ5969984.1 phage tail protein [Escherichia coli]MCQ5999602.1 phage tail protein [Escherichia coli]MCQ6015128.1 phage tail protein [Escherichia coli]MCQ6030248.1 phage tail protein [Escherichia coli]